MLLLRIAKYLIDLGTIKDELLRSGAVHQPPIWKSRENVLAVWIALAFVFHALLVLIVRRCRAEWKCCGFWMRMRAMKKGICPHRRARWMKCYRRANRRHNNNDKEENEEWPCPFETAFWRLQMPPPLPFHHRKHRRHHHGCKQLSSATTEEETKTSTNTNIEKQDIASSDQQVTIVDMEQQQQQPTGKKSIPAPARAPVVHTSLIDLARMQHWDTLKRQVNRREAKHHDADGLYPLHWACSGSPPAVVIQLLLETYRSAARKADNEGSLALHFATHYGASASVVEIVLKAYEPAIRKQDKYGRTPLFHAVAKAAGLEVLRILVSADPSMVTTPCLPPDKPKKYRQHAHWVKRTPLYLSWSAVLSDRQARQRRAGKVWDKAQFLLEAAFNMYRDLRPTIPRVYRILHSAVAMDSLLPPGVVELAIQARPNQLQEPEETEGRLPLAVAASTPHASRRRSDILIKVLLQAYPAATRILDSKGRTPLILAALSGKSWDAGIASLLQADPDVIDWRDPVTGLYPASLAATVADVTVDDDLSESTLEETEEMICLLPGKVLESLRRASDNSSLSGSSSSSLSTSSSSSDESDTPSLRVSTIYQLLQANPSIIS